MRASLILQLLTILLTGCVAEDYTVSAGNADTASDNSTESTFDTGSQDTDLFSQPAWWRLSAQLFLQDGVPLTKQSGLSLTLLSDKDEELCTEEIGLELAEAVTPPHESVLVWWKLTPQANDSLCGAFDVPLPAELHLGVGAMHPDILAALGGLPNISSGEALNGAYAVLDDPTALYVFGVAGTPMAFEGEGEAASKSPLEDGTWRVEPVYRFSY